MCISEPNAELCAKISVLSEDYYMTLAAMICQKKAMERAKSGYVIYVTYLYMFYIC